MVALGTQIGSVPNPGHTRWWFSIPAGASPLDSIAFYVSFALLIIGWLGLGREAFQGRLTAGRSWVILAVWGLPFFVGPPLFGRDIYSYIGQGLVAHQGFNPYLVSPSVLGHGQVLTAIASVWRGTASPYGPLFVASTKMVAGLSGSSLIVEVFAFRALELIGVALIMVSLPRLARHLGTDPGIALWLGGFSPLALLSYVSSGHNDALMVGLLVAGVTLAVEGRMVSGLTLCALAATVKLPAAAAIVFLEVDQFRTNAATKRWKLLGQAILIPITVFLGVTLACGFGWSWLGPNALHIPTEVHTLATPGVSVGVFFSHLLGLVGIPVAKYGAVAVSQIIFGVGVAIGCAWLLFHVHRYNVVRCLGLALLLVVIGSPTLWPWYLMWGLTLLAATDAQRAKVLAGIAALAMLVVGPSGNPLLGGDAYIVVTLATLAVGVWFIRDRHWRGLVSAHVA
jgi:alpha-1,6-mannosyltransferase